MDNLLSDILKTKMNDMFMEQVGKKTGVGADKAGSVMKQALPFLMGAMAKNAMSKKGAASLEKAVTKDHDGSVLDNLSGLIDNPEKNGASGILKHLLGRNTKNVEGYISQKSGVDSRSVDTMMKVLAPMLMGALGKAKASGKLNMSNIGSTLSSLTDKSGSSSVSMNLVTKFLDKNGDGDIKDDLLNMGKKWIMAKLSGRGRA